MSDLGSDAALERNALYVQDCMCSVTGATARRCGAPQDETKRVWTRQQIVGGRGANALVVPDCAPVAPLIYARVVVVLFLLAWFVGAVFLGCGSGAVLVSLDDSWMIPGGGGSSSSSVFCVGGVCGVE